MSAFEAPNQARIVDCGFTEGSRAHPVPNAKIRNVLKERLNGRMNGHKEEDIRNFLHSQQDNSQFLVRGLSSYKGSMDVVRKLIDERIKALGLDYADVSRRLGRNVAYIQQFLKKGSPRELHERDRLLLAEILKVPEEDLRGPSSILPKRSYEKKPGTSRESLIDLTAHVPHSGPGNAIKNVPGTELFGANDLPVFGTAPGGKDGALTVSEIAVDWVARPAVLARVRDGYGIIVTDDTMSPEHKSGSIALVNPHLPARVGSSCVFRARGDDGMALVLIREFRGQTETHWKVHQHNPPKDTILKKSDWSICHRTVGSYFP